MGKGTTYRLDIQGLRALAIALVVLAHAGVPGFAGGFVGVDVFFVLSGFLITRLLVQERLDTGKIRYWEFLARRLRRLLPALLVMLVIVLVVAWSLLSTYEARLQTGAFAYSVTWTSNFYFAFAELDYFSPLRAKDLFLHTWSLGVEEQFYVVWPWLIAIAFALSGADAKSRRVRKHLLALVSILSVASFGLSLYWAKTNPLAAFYMMPSRGWQFALGAAVYVCSSNLRMLGIDSGSPRWVRDASQYAGWAGLALIVGSAMLLNPQLAYPGYFALLPSVGAAVLILAGAQTGISGTSRLLESKTCVWVGDRSYSLYLWHWPVLILGDTFGLGSGPLGVLALIALSVVLAMLSYRWVELPIWKGRFSKVPSRLVALTSTFAMMSVLMVSQIYVADVFTGAVTQGGRETFTSHSDQPLPFGAGLKCDSWFSSAEVEPCKTGGSSARHTVVLIGDSIGAQWASFLPKVYGAPEWRIQVLTKSACAIVDVEYYYKPAGGFYEVCTKWREAAMDYIAGLNPDIVFLGSSTGYGFSESQWVGGTERLVKKLAASVGQVVIIPGTPRLTFHGPSCIREPYRYTSRLRQSKNICEEPLTSTVSDDVAGYLDRVASNIPNVQLLDLNDLVCPDRLCAARTKTGVPVFRDDMHLTSAFVYAKIPEISARLNSIGAGPSTLLDGLRLTYDKLPN